MTSLALPSANVASSNGRLALRLQGAVDLGGVAVLLAGIVLGAVMFVAQSF